MQAGTEELPAVPVLPPPREDVSPPLEDGCQQGELHQMQKQVPTSQDSATSRAPTSIQPKFLPSGMWLDTEGLSTVQPRPQHEEPCSSPYEIPDILDSPTAVRDMPSEPEVQLNTEQFPLVSDHAAQVGDFSQQRGKTQQEQEQVSTNDSLFRLHRSVAQTLKGSRIDPEGQSHVQMQEQKEATPAQTIVTSTQQQSSLCINAPLAPQKNLEELQMVQAHDKCQQHQDQKPALSNESLHPGAKGSPIAQPPNQLSPSKLRQALEHATLHYHGGAKLNALVGAYFVVQPFVDGLPTRGVNLVFSIEPALPAGLELDPNTGIVSGIPVEVVAAMPYEVTIRGSTRRHTDFVRTSKGAHAHLLLCVTAPPPPARPHGATGATGEEVQLPAAADVRRMFRAVHDDNTQHLLASTEAGALLKDHPFSQDMVDDHGRTLFEVAQACGNQRAVNFFRNSLKAGPSFFADRPRPAELESPAWLTPLGNELPAEAPPTPGYGIDPRKFRSDASQDKPRLPICEVQYKDVPVILRVNQWYCFKPHVTTNGIGVEIHSIMSSMRYTVSPDLPAGFLLDVQTGIVQGLTTEEFEKTSFEVNFHVGADRFRGSDGGSPIKKKNRHERFMKVVEATCDFELAAISAPAGLAYAIVEAVVDISQVDKTKSLSPPSAQSGHSRPKSAGPKWRPQSAHGLQALLNALKFEAVPTQGTGRVDYYEVTPNLPQGMRFDRDTGMISGVPEHKFPATFRHTFEVFGRNSVGVSSCKVSLEVLAGTWNLVHMKLHTVGDTSVVEATQKGDQRLHGDSDGSDNSGASTPSGGSGVCWLDHSLPASVENILSPSCALSGNSSRLARARPDVLTNHFHWAGAVGRVAVVLERFGQLMRVDEPRGVAGVKMVRGMPAASLLPLLGLTEDTHHIRRLLRVIEQCGQEHRHHPALVGSRGPEASVAVDAENASCAGDAVVYLRREHALSPSRPQSARKQASQLSSSKAVDIDLDAWEKVVGKWPHPMEPSRAIGAETDGSGSCEHTPDPKGAASKVNADFGNLLPSWRSKLRDSHPQARQDRLRHWRGQALS